MRAFLGIGLPAGTREAIVSAIAPVRGLHAPVAWTAPENLHITLNFLGEILPERVALLAAVDAGRGLPESARSRWRRREGEPFPARETRESSGSGSWNRLNW